MPIKLSRDFDNLKFDSHWEHHVTKLLHDGNEVEFLITIEDQYTIDNGINVAQKHWNERATWFAKCQKLAVEKQLGHINCFLDGSDLPRMTKAKLRRLLATPSSIHLRMYKDQTWFSLDYFSQEFGQHVVKVFISPDTGAMDCDVQPLY